MGKSQQTISAQVILKSAADNVPDNAITAEHIGGLLPTAEDVKLATKVFRDLGFKVGDVVGTSFSISASAGIFEKVFNIKIVGDAQKGIQCKWKDNSVKDHLPLSALPKDASGLVKAIVFTPPPDFGPGNY